MRIKIRLIEGNAKCRHPNNWLVKDSAAGVYTVYLSDAQNPIPTPPLTYCIEYVYTEYLFTQGRGEGGELN
jgi:hypothetical protein